MLYRNFYRFADSQTLLKLYTSLVRPHTEYTCAVWDSHLSKDILAVENTQRFALRICLKNWRASYDSLLSRCGIPCLSTRRNFLKLCWLFNIFSGRIVLPCSPLSRRCSLYPNRYPNSIQLTTLHTRTNSFKYSFFRHHQLWPGTLLTLILPAQIPCYLLNMLAVASHCVVVCFCFCISHV